MHVPQMEYIPVATLAGALHQMAVSYWCAQLAQVLLKMALL